MVHVSKETPWFYPYIWGRLCHDLLLMIAAEYPEEADADRQASLYTGLLNLFRNLPCSVCQNDAPGYLLTHPPDFSTQANVQQYLVDMHNHLNAKHGKKSDWTVKEAYEALRWRYGPDVMYLPRSVQMRLEDARQHAKDQQRIRELEALAGIPLEQRSKPPASREKEFLLDWRPSLLTEYGPPREFGGSGERANAVYYGLLAILALLLVAFLCLVGIRLFL